jgi:hypothetical protein
LASITGRRAGPIDTGRGGFNTFLTSVGLLLITHPFAAVPVWGIARMGLGVIQSKTYMTDLIYIGITVLFFVVSGLYVRFCEKL